jgi:hypothetical protein
MKMFRQGDVLVVACDEVPADAELVARDNGRIVLAYGEVTGHAHAIHSPFAALVAKGAERFLKVDKAVQLKHEEHSKIDLPAGNYRVIRQVEYTPEAIRTVAD